MKKKFESCLHLEEFSIAALPMLKVSNICIFSWFSTVSREIEGLKLGALVMIHLEESR